MAGSRVVLAEDSQVWVKSEDPPVLTVTQQCPALATSHQTKLELKSPTSESMTYQSAVDSNGYRATSDSNGYRATSESNGYQATSDSNGYQATSDSNGYQATSDSNGYPATSDSNCYQATSDSNGYQASSLSNGYTTTSDGNGYQVVSDSNGYPSATSDSRDVDKATTDQADAEQNGAETTTCHLPALRDTCLRDPVNTVTHIIITGTSQLSPRATESHAGRTETTAHLEREDYTLSPDTSRVAPPAPENHTTATADLETKTAAQSDILSHGISPLPESGHTDTSRSATERGVFTRSLSPDSSLRPPPCLDMASPRMASQASGRPAPVEAGDGVKPKRTKRRVPGQRTCGVCGDRAIAHNFGALTCETCKAFFRRNAHKSQDLPPCSFNKTCIINKTTRRFCTSCRMEKCFAVGMDPHLILDDAEKRAMRARRKDKQRLQQEVVMTTDSASATRMASSPIDCSPSLPHPHHPHPHPHHTSQSSISDTDFPSGCLPVDASSLELSPVSSALSEFYSHSDLSQASHEVDGVTTTGLSHGAGTPRLQAQPGQADPAATPISDELTLSGQSLALGRGFQHVERNELPWDIQLYWLLTQEERTLLTQITSSYTNIQLALNPPEHLTSSLQQQPSRMDVMMYNLEATLRKSVLFAKAIPEFRALREVDQIALLKASALKTYMLRSAALYIVERNAWPSSLGDIHVRDVRDAFQSHQAVDDFAEFCLSLKSVTQANFKLYGLLHCIALFDVRDTQLEQRGQVNVLQDKYTTLLKHYLQAQFSYLHAGRYMLELLAQLEDIHNAGPKVMVFYKQYSSFFRPLVAEFLAP